MLPIELLGLSANQWQFLSDPDSFVRTAKETERAARPKKSTRRPLRSLKPRSVQVVKHSYAVSGQTLKCDLLIVDEAHRAKSCEAQFSRSLENRRKYAKRILILTANPIQH